MPRYTDEEEPKTNLSPLEVQEKIAGIRMPISANCAIDWTAYHNWYKESNTQFIIGGVNYYPPVHPEYIDKFNIISTFHFSNNLYYLIEFHSDNSKYQCFIPAEFVTINC